MCGAKGARTTSNCRIAVCHSVVDSTVSSLPHGLRQEVEVLHERGHRGVELELLDVFGDLLGQLVDLQLELRDQTGRPSGLPRDASIVRCASSHRRFAKR